MPSESGSARETDRGVARMRPPRLRPYLVALTIGSAAIGFFSYRTYLTERGVLEASQSSELRGIAELKAAQVAAWRGERLSDARVLVADSLLMPAVLAVLDGTTDPAARAAASAWTEVVRTSYRYASVILVDPAGVVRLSAGTRLGPAPYAIAVEALRGDAVLFRDFGRSAAIDKPHFALAAAIRAADGRPRGAVVLEIDPAMVLYPMTLQWPDRSDTGDVQLVRRDGDSALYLSELRRRPGSAMARRENLANDTLPAVKAVLGLDGFARAADDRGVPLLTAAARVDDSPWIVVATIEEAEAYRALGRNALVLSTVFVALSLTFAAGVLLVWRHEVSTFYRQQYEAESERRALQEVFDAELRTSRERLALALEAANEGHWEWDAQHRTTFVSQRYHDMLGYGPGELEPGYETVRALTHPDDVASLDRVFDALSKGQDAYSIECRMRGKSGAYIWVLARGKVVARDDEGRPARMVGTQTDVTERRTLEDQLRQSQKLESIGRLAGGVAHDFNNLLTVINGYSDLLVARLADHEALKDLARQVRKAGQRAAGLTQQLLAFSRKQVTQPRPTSLNGLVTDSEKMVSRLLGDDITLVVRTDAPSDQVTVDPGQLHQVLINLVVNARDAMPKGGTLTVETSTIDWAPQDGTAPLDLPAGPYVLLTVTDTGTGMDEETAARVFEPFFTTKGPGRGTGLGLSTVYGIVRQSGGFIRLTSAPGQGTAFTIYLPRTQHAAVPESAPRPLSLRGSERVLVVEDQHDVRNLVARSLRSYGYNVTEAASGAEALAWSEAHPDSLDLVVTDLMMPGLNGRELVERLVHSQRAVRVLFMSGYSHDVLGEKGILDPSVALIQKPFGPMEIAEKVRTVLNRFEAPRRVLVVDDEEAIRALFEQLLAPLGCEVLVAADGREAIDAVKQGGGVDLVILDLIMPEQEGIETIVAMRREFPGLKIIAMSGAFGGQFLKVARRLGADAILNKPVDAIRLREVLGEVFGDRTRIGADAPRQQV